MTKMGFSWREKKKNLKEIVLKVNNHEEAWRLFKNSLLETQEKCLPQPKMNRHLKINIKCLNGKGKKAVQKKERMRQVIFLGRKRIFQEKSGNPINVTGQIYTKLNNSKLLNYQDTLKGIQNQTPKCSNKERKAGRVLMELLEFQGKKLHPST